MYLQALGLSAKPFLITPDPQFLYHSPIHQAALAHLDYGLQREGGFLLLTGEVGTGKTTLCRYLIDRLPAEFRLAYVLNARLDSQDLLLGICRELQISVEEGASVRVLVDSIYDNLLMALKRGQKTLIVIEEAQNLSADVLEFLRLLTNLETSSEKLLHILLVGQPELLDTLQQKELRQLQQRVVARSHLRPLTVDEVEHYVEHRLRCAGSTQNLFTSGTIKALYRYSRGYPRLINLLAEHCLLGAYSLGHTRVNSKVVRQAYKELQPHHNHQQPRDYLPILRWGVAASVLFGAACFYLIYGQSIPLLAQAKPMAVYESAAAEREKPQALDVGVNEDVVVESVVSKGAVVKKEAQLLPNAFTRLLRDHDVFDEARSEKQMCDIASSHGYECVVLEGEFDSALLVDYQTALVSVKTDAESSRRARLGRDQQGVFSLSDSRGERPIEPDKLAALLEGSAIVLWRPPTGYEKPLIEGQSNPQLVDFLQKTLIDRDYLEQRVVTGGLYTRFLVEKVKAFQRDHDLIDDGIVGQRTLQKLDRKAAGFVMSGGW